MNVILLNESEFVDDRTVRLSGRRARHIHAVLKSVPGDRLVLGRLGGRLGRGTLSNISADSVELCDVVLDRDPPPPVPVTLVLALPRPIVLNRLLASVTALGVKRIFLIHSRRVEKSYWNSPVLRPENIDKQLRLGLEQAVDTVGPEVILRKRFKPFVEDELPELLRGSCAWLAHPGPMEKPCGKQGKKAVLIVGPEGGFIPYEVERFGELSIPLLSLGERILRVETAVHVAVTKVEGMLK